MNTATETPEMKKVLNRIRFWKAKEEKARRKVKEACDEAFRIQNRELFRTQSREWLSR